MEEESAFEMLTLYWFCLVFGGTFVALSVLGGLDGLDLDHHLDTDFEISDGGNRLVEQSFSVLKLIFAIVRSLKFWTFGLCFFGLTGVILSHLQIAGSPLLIAVIAGMMGCLFGSVVAGILAVLRNRQVDSLVRSPDLVGLSGIVELPFDANSRGKVRVKVKGSVIRFVAYTDDQTALKPGDVVLVVGVQQNRLWVVSANSTSSA